MKVSELRFKLTLIWQQYGDLDIIIPDNGINIMLESEMMEIKNNCLYIE